MFEMLVTIIAASAAFLFGLSQTVFMRGPHRHYYQAGAIVVILLLIFIYLTHQALKRSRLRKLKVNPADYHYYDKFTSFLYRVGYLVSYLIQSILFDYTYMRRNFNFCKGLDVYDGGVSEYYIKFRNTWYRYLSLLWKRHKLSLRKLQQFACRKKNQMIYDAIEDLTKQRMFPDGLEAPEIKLHYNTFTNMALDFTEEHRYMNDYVLRSFPYYDEIHYYFRENLIKICTAQVYIMEKEPIIVNMVSRQTAYGRQDVDDYKKMS